MLLLVALLIFLLAYLSVLFLIMIFTAKTLVKVIIKLDN